MSALRHAIHRIATIEITSLRGVCPFLYKTKCHTYVAIPHVKLDNQNEVVVGNRPIPLADIYFKTGYGSYVPFLAYISKKYRIKNQPEAPGDTQPHEINTRNAGGYSNGVLANFKLK